MEFPHKELVMVMDDDIFENLDVSNAFGDFKLILKEEHKIEATWIRPPAKIDDWIVQQADLLDSLTQSPRDNEISRLFETEIHGKCQFTKGLTNSRAMVIKECKLTTTVVKDVEVPDVNEANAYQLVAFHHKWKGKIWLNLDK